VKQNVARLAAVAGRIALLGAVTSVLALVAVQFAGILARNVAIAHEIASTKDDIVALRERTRRQELTIRRLSDAHGAIPEIHDMLRLVGPHEEIIYVRGLAQPTAQPDEEWNGAR